MQVTLRPATRADIPLLQARDKEPHVRVPDRNSGKGGGREWQDEIAAGLAGLWHFLAGTGGTPTGCVEVIDPAVEPATYWGPMPEGFRAIDIRIGPAEWLGRAAGMQVMRLARGFCFAAPSVHTGPDRSSRKQYPRAPFLPALRFTPVGCRDFDGGQCLVHELKRADWRKES